MIMDRKKLLELIKENVEVVELQEDNFKPFSKIEELFIKKEDLADYYRNKREYEFNNGISQVKGTKWRDLLHPILLKLLSLNRKYIDKQNLTILNDARRNDKKKTFGERVKNIFNKEKSKPVIYAITHIDKYDFQLVSEAIKEHQYPFAGDPETMYRSFDGLALGLNGVIYCDTESKTDRNIAKNTAIETLEKGHNLLIYPEGVWNVTSNLLMLPLFPGIIEMAKETGCEIVPVAIERYDKDYIVNIGSEFDVNQYLNTGLSVDQVKEKLRDEMATLKWSIMESLPKEQSAEEIYYNTRRRDLGSYDEEEEKFKTERLNEWTNPETKMPYYNWELIKSRTFKEKDKYTGYRVNIPEDAFSYMSRVKIKRNNIFMFPTDRSLPNATQRSLDHNLQSSIPEFLDDFDQDVKKVV